MNGSIAPPHAQAGRLRSEPVLSAPYPDSSASNASSTSSSRDGRSFSGMPSFVARSIRYSLQAQSSRTARFSSNDRFSSVTTSKGASHLLDVADRSGLPGCGWHDFRSPLSCSARHHRAQYPSGCAPQHCVAPGLLFWSRAATGPRSLAPAVRSSRPRPRVSEI